MRYLVLLLLLCAGCASYDFQVTPPAASARLITDTPQSFQTRNMSYEMQEKENRLVVQIWNMTDQPVQLLGHRSFVVDPRGATHPLRSQPIAPSAYAKLVLPPLRPRFETMPHFELGVGAGISRDQNSATPGPAAVQYLDVYEDADAYYWDWDGPDPIRLSLTYQFADGHQATDQFTISRITRD